MFQLCETIDNLWLATMSYKGPQTMVYQHANYVRIMEKLKIIYDATIWPYPNYGETMDNL